MARRLPWLIVLAALGCGASPPPPPPAPHLASQEAWARLRAARTLGEAGREDEAVRALDALLAERIPDEVRREALSSRVTFDRRRFLRAHPLVLALEIEPSEEGIPGDWTLRARLHHLGAEPLRLGLEGEDGFFRWRSRPAARALLRIRCAVHDAGAAGSSFDRVLERDLVVEEDVVLPPGGSIEFREALDVPAAPSVLTRTIRAEARLLPAAVAGPEGGGRSFAIDFPAAALRRSASLPGGERDAFAWLVEALEGEAGDPRTLFVAAASLPPDRLREGLGMIARAAPSLDPPRSRAALAALEEWTRHRFAGDATGAAAWWEAVGSRRPVSEWLRRTGLDAGNPSVAALAGRAP